MLMQVLAVMELLDDPSADGRKVCDLFKDFEGVHAEYETVRTSRGKTDIVRITISGRDSSAPVLGIVGQLGGVGARPEMVGLVSDADGAIAALACALKLAEMKKKGKNSWGLSSSPRTFVRMPRPKNTNPCRSWIRRLV